MKKYRKVVDGVTVFDTEGNDPFTLMGIQYPADWFKYATEEDLRQLGIQVYEVPDPPPGKVSRRQAKLALHRRGLLKTVKQMVAQDEELQIWYDDALEWLRNDPRIKQMAVALKLTDADVDDLFRYAATL